MFHVIYSYFGKINDLKSCYNMNQQLHHLDHFFNKDHYFKTLFHSIPLGVLLLNSERKIVAINDFMLQTFGAAEAKFIGGSIGKILNCINSDAGENFCGATASCKNCQLFRSTVSAIQGKEVKRHKAEVKVRIGGKIRNKELLITINPVTIDNNNYWIVFFEDMTELNELTSQINHNEKIRGMIGHDPEIFKLKEQIYELAQVDVPVMVLGESGTGKELVAKALHHEGPRRDKPFVAVNCSALQDNLLESELFGHMKGAFTGAISDHKGRFEMADGGTIFLDEIGDISPAMQVKLLRILQEGIFEPVGGEHSKKVDVRVISATNKDIKKQITTGRFREDLFYRLCVVPLYTPPLRKRKGDLPLLADNFLKKFLSGNGRGNIVMSDDSLNVLLEYDWPGNIRELQNAIQYALVQCKGRIIEPNHLPLSIKRRLTDAGKPVKKARKKKLERASVREALRKTNGNKLKAAKSLHVSRATMYRFLEANGMID